MPSSKKSYSLLPNKDTATKYDAWILLFSGLIIFFSTTSLLINRFIYHYPSNNYFPDNTIYFGVTLFLFYLGSTLLFGPRSKLTAFGIELLYFFFLMCLIAFATNAVQLTPFSPIDKYIVTFEESLHINMEAILFWTNQHPNLSTLLNFTYDTLTKQMGFIPLFIIALVRIVLLREYYFLMLFTTLVGFLFYYFFPTTAPASVIKSPYFSSYQMATGIKFNQIHQFIPPTTIEGGLIALPSFHCIWALLCVYLVKDWRIFFYMLLILNSILIVSCVLTGWHYPIDILAGILLTGFAYWLLLWAKKSKFLFEHDNL